MSTRIEQPRNKRHGDAYSDAQRERSAEDMDGTAARTDQDRGPEEPSDETVGTNERLEGEDA
jgi:hypothetical protein